MPDRLGMDAPDGIPVIYKWSASRHYRHIRAVRLGTIASTYHTNLPNPLDPQP